ncbi:hypothetical protein AB1Y20_014004 [Prymnesium parvum]|uniref:AMP-dependent synthetase/ligase domain-containing protein n=1 Tax=Prymnesium parvum TaxID=97485 RepID=A0AB34IEK8_PRYPA
METFQASIKAEPVQSLATLIGEGDDPVFFSDLPPNAAQRPLTFSRLKAFVRAFDVRRFGLTRTDTLCTSMANGPEAAVCFWAVAEQCVYAPLNPSLTAAEVEFELEDLPCHTMLVLREDDDASAAALRTATVRECCERFGVPLVTMERDATWCGLFQLLGKEVAAPPPPFPTRAEDLALVLHTSGTTKKPKIVPLTHANLASGIQFVAHTLRRGRDDVCLNVMPLFHIHGIVANVGVSVFSHSQVICSSFMGGAHFVDLLSDGRRAPIPLWYSAVPTMHEAILLEAEARGDSLRHSLRMMRNCSAALLPPVSHRFLHAFGTRLGQPFTVVPTYAMTESFPICSNPPHLEVKLPTVGPAMGPKVKILQAHPVDEEVPVGAEGEVCVAGPCVTAGYLVRPHMSVDPNVEAFSLPSAPMGRMLRTGDKGFVDADGYVQLVGRFKEIINCGGEKVSPLELEDAMLQVEGVETCVCFATPAELLGEVVGCAVVAKAGHQPPTLQQLRDGMRKGSTWLPRVLVRTNAIPKGPTGKPKRIGLAKMWGLPTLPQNELLTFTIEGEGEKYGRLMYAAEEAYPQCLFFRREAPVLRLPLRVRLDYSPDLAEEDGAHTVHQLEVWEEGGGLRWAMEVTSWAAGEPKTAAFVLAEAEVHEVLKHLRMRLSDHGFMWKSGSTDGAPTDKLNYDWCGVLSVWEGGEDEAVMRHEWPNHCTEVPPGALMRLLRVLEVHADEVMEAA